ncbi:MAG: TerB family tellurite resistance protein [Rubrivivax sp.]
MLKTLKDLFDSLLAPPGAAATAGDEHRLQLAAAVLLVEVMRADAEMRPDERAAVQAALVETFGLTSDEAARLAELAVSTAREATDLYGFTARLDEQFSMDQKVRLVELMWRVAYADGHLGDHERHTLWRVADLLHVPQGAYVLARQRARDDAAR